MKKKVSKSKHAADVLVDKMSFELATRSLLSSIVFNGVNDFCKEFESKLSPMRVSIDEVCHLHEQFFESLFAEKVFDG